MKGGGTMDKPKVTIHTEPPKLLATAKEITNLILGKERFQIIIKNFIIKRALSTTRINHINLILIQFLWKKLKKIS